MLKGKNELEKYLEKQVINLVSDDEKCRSISNYAKTNYDIPRSLTLDVITMRMSLSEVSEFVLFCLLDSIENVNNVTNTKLSEFFAPQEVKTYKKAKYKINKIKFPLRFSCIQVADDQWIGSIDIDYLMQLREAQMINYNTNAQRTMQRIIQGDKDYYKIAINTLAVNQIKNLFEKNVYIPTPFTLNISQDSESDFYYDDEKKELVIKSLEYFDITDGYHRYVAACQLKDSNPDFNYTMELRISNWSDNKAKQFIYQEDQKTKMKKVDSDSLNMNKAANVVVSRLNENPSCNLQGLISRNKGIINYGDLAGLVDYFYFKNVNKDKEKSTIISSTKELIEDFNLITEHNTVYIEKEYSYKQLAAIMYLFYFYKGKKDKKRMIETVDLIVEKSASLDNKKFYSKTPKKSAINDLEKIVLEVG